MAEIDAYLADGEELELITNRHASVLVRPLLLLLLGSVIAALVGLVARLGGADEYLDLAAGLIVLAFASNFFIAVLRWRVEEIALTDRRILRISGLWRKQVTSVPYGRIVDVTLTRGFWARLVRSGDVILDLGEGRVRISGIPRAKNFSRWVVSLASGQAPSRLDPSAPADREDTGPLPRHPL